MRFPQDVPTLTDGTVTLRAHRESDVEGALEQCLDPLSRAWTTVPIPYTRDDARRFVREAMPGGWRTEQEWAFAVEHDGEYAGTVSLRNEGEGRAEIAYGSHPRIRGTGGMERALRLLLEWGFADRDLESVIWWANRGNWASRKLAWRLGFDVGPTVVRRWLPQRGQLLDAWVGTLLRDDERAPRHPWLDLPVIESPSLPLRLRPARADDAGRAMEGRRDGDTAYWFGGQPAYTEAAARALALSHGEQAALGTGLPLVVADRDDDRLLGVVELFAVSTTFGSAEVGYWVHPAERGRGVATEAVRLLVRHGLLPRDVGGLGLSRVLAHAAVANAGSRRVLEAAGFTEVGVERRGTRTRDGLADAVLYELLAPQ